MMTKDLPVSHTGNEKLDNNAGDTDSEASVPEQKRKFNDDAGFLIIEYVEQLSNTATSSSLASLLHTRKATPDPRYVKELLYAIRRGSLVIIEIILSHVDIDAQDPRTGRTALSIAAELGDAEVTRFLLVQGAIPNIRQYSLSYYRLVNKINQRYCSSMELYSIFPLSPNLTLQGLLRCTLRPEPIILRLLLLSGADPDALMAEDMTALHLAAAKGWVDGINVLLNAHASINVRDACTRETSFHKAARNIKMETIGILCARNANTEIKNIDGLNYQTLLDRARLSPDDWCVDPNLGSYCTFY
ncbi:uncharacterized protein N7483_011551 [Penicillium malachiteum]|uniref:uncharacterized protein n=1 Tax=Penicillium malachiteum TaxID=1324776 RepID=UPI002546B3A3|nr:uncharacterized protein N7483_011551 [Penicillium malachiteum]KAJ5714370.1 hypothetical protein N7483_011551 [Penicillium malachiteum]